MTKNLYKTHPEANFLQSDKWAAVNEKLGHKVKKLEFENGHQALCIIKNAKRGRYLEIPGGPLLDWSDKKLLKSAFKAIFDLAKSEKCVFVRFRPQLLNTPENQKLIQTLPKLTGLNFQPAPFHLHAQNTVILDLTKPEDALLAEMRRQTRYEVRRAEKLALKVEKGHSEALFREFHSTQLETAKRQGFIPPSLEDLLAYHEVFGDDAVVYKVSLAGDEQTPSSRQTPEVTTEDVGARAPRRRARGTPVAEKNGDCLSPICYGIIIKDGPEAEYFEAASTDLGRKYPGACALQWQAIRDLKSEGLKRYNLWGIAPPDPDHPGEHLKNHRYSRVTTFKTGFGGTQTDFIPAVDLIVNKNRYKLTFLIETVRKKRRHLS